VNLDNANRQNVKRLISLFPGVHLRMLSRYLGVSLNTARYHLLNLEKNGEVFCRREGEYLRAYPPWAADERSMGIYAVLQQKSARRILRVILSEARLGGLSMSNDKISSFAHLSQSTVSEYLTLLRDLQLVKRVITREGRVVFEISQEARERLSTILGSYDENVLSRTTDRYLSLWEF